MKITALKDGQQLRGADEDLGDIRATMLYQLGIDPTKLIYRLQGRDYRLTDVFGKVVKGILA